MSNIQKIIERILAGSIEMGWVSDAEAIEIRALAAPVASAAPEHARQTDLSKKLRAKTNQPFGPEDFALLEKAAEEIERYYGGMLNWKACAEAKDAALAASSPKQAPEVQGELPYVERFSVYEDHGRANMMGDDDGEYVRFDQMQAYARAAVAAEREQIALGYESQANDYINEHATTELDTGALVWKFGDAGRDYHSMLLEIAEEIRARK